ncbi:MAG: hypothetical protein WA191_19850 [Telluria sp.]
MADSRDFNEHEQIQKTGGRQEFSHTTRQNLAAAAGEKCSIYRCLKQSACIAIKKSGNVGKANFGTASHIYAAAPGGPRPAPPGMTPEQIAHHSNGIWTCRACGTTVDTLESDYTAAQLLEMKRVREIAQKMAASDPQIRDITSYISPLEFDEVLWDHLPDLDTKQIRLALLEIGAKAILAHCDHANRRTSTPSHLALKPLASVVKAVTEEAAHQIRERTAAAMLPLRDVIPVEDEHVKARRKAAEIVEAWAKPMRQRGWKGFGWHIHHVNVKLTAQNPLTGAICDGFIWVVGNGYGRHDHTAHEGEILRLHVSNTCRSVSNLNWQLTIAFEKGTLRTGSTLRLGGRLAPRNFANGYEWAEFEAYELLVRKLAEGWQPIGFVNMETEERLNPNGVHPEAFEIKLQISQTELEECLYRCGKIRLAREIEMEWGRWFICNEDYFDHALDPFLIRRASDELRAQMGPPPYRYAGESPVLLSLGRRDIKLVVKGVYISFQSVPSRC